MKQILYRAYVYRHKCIACGKLIDDGQEITIIKTMKKKYYPIKGIMEFTVFHFKHIKC